ncbi:hypothetical protein Cantr_08559 [Candida viswanathii]|uniref:Cell wall galactomannoprotein n=1 Tax=Candida viswanathii TaxID=5486 RepID=A0A367Y5T9_9ASCO|nr:hypothetical protein Cantr_08559 [Candida viswanathii]
MRFSYFLTTAVVALSAQAAAIEPETIQEIDKRTTIGLAGTVAGDLLHLISASLGLSGLITFKRELEKRTTFDATGDLTADILGLLGFNATGEVDVNTKREETDSPISLQKRASLNLAAGLAVNILQLIGISVGGSVGVSTKRDVSQDQVIDVLNLVQAQLAAASADGQLQKRDFDVKQLAEDIPHIVAGIITAVETVTNGTIAALL